MIFHCTDSFRISMVANIIKSKIFTFFVTFLIVKNDMTRFWVVLGSGLQRVRANLYGALLYYLQIAQKPISLQVLNSGASIKFIEYSCYETI